MLAREELLFKSFVRLLDHVTDQRWTYQPNTADAQADLLVTCHDFQTAADLSPTQTQHVLRLGYLNENGHDQLSWPLKAHLLEQELNRLGGAIVRQRMAPSKPIVATALTPNRPAAPDLIDCLMRLQRWPPAQLLAGTGRVRLATLLTGKVSPTVV